MATLSRRQFLRDGVSVAALGFALPAWIGGDAAAQAAASRVVVVLNLAGGNDALSMVVPYTDSFYYSRRPTIAVPAGQVLQVGSDASRKALGLHPRLTGLRTLFDQGTLALIQRVGYQNSSRSHFLGGDIWSSASPESPESYGWLGRYLDQFPRPADPLIAWSTAGTTPHMLLGRTEVANIPAPASYTFTSPNTGAEVQYARTTATRLATDAILGGPHLAAVGTGTLDAMATVDRVAAVNTYSATVTYPTSTFAQALRTIAAAIVKDVGARIFWVQLGGFDTHASQGTNATTGTYSALMAALGDGLAAFATDLRNQGLFDRVLVLQFSEFSRRVSENGSQGTDHGAATVMMVAGGRVKGGLYGTAPSLNPDPANPTLENSGGDVHYETDFRSVYARVLDTWLGVDSVALLGGNFRQPGLDFI